MTFWKAALFVANENEKYKPVSFQKGRYLINVDFNEELMPGNYSLGVGISHFHTGSSIDLIESFYPFTISKESKSKNMEYPWATIRGYIKPKTTWNVTKI